MNRALDEEEENEIDAVRTLTSKQANAPAAPLM